MKKVIYKRWHDLLDMPKKDKAWHENDVADEYQELQEATGLISRWSEYSDVVYTVTRGRWSGHDIESPLSPAKFMFGSIYMFPKCTMRYLFFRRAGRRAGAEQPLKEVRNPKKTHKLHYIAKKYNLDPDEFTAICERQLRYWMIPK